MSGTLLVTESTRSYGEFRRSWVRAAFERYVRRYRRRLVRAVEEERARGPVTLLTARQLLGDARLPTGVSVRYYDEESYKVDSRALGDSTARLVADSWPSAESAPELSHRGVWLPDLLTISRSIVLRMEIVEPLGILEHVCREVDPDRVMVLSGASIPERLALLVAERSGTPARPAAPGMVSSRVLSVALRALYPREERVRLRDEQWRRELSQLKVSTSEELVAAAFAEFDNVSRRHATVQVDDAGHATIKDEGSTNGTYVNEDRVLPGAEVRLVDGDRVRLAADVTGNVSLPQGEPDPSGLSRNGVR